MQLAEMSAGKMRRSGAVEFPFWEGIVFSLTAESQVGRPEFCENLRPMGPELLNSEVVKPRLRFPV